MRITEPESTESAHEELSDESDHLKYTESIAPSIANIAFDDDEIEEKKYKRVQSTRR